MSEVTFVLPVYNAQTNIAQCLERLLAQKHRAEIIVIDDGSTDNTARILNSFSGSVIVFNNEERKGAAYCRNLGNDRATGDIIAVCDTDIYDKERSEIITAFFKKYKDHDVFYSALNIKHGYHTYRMGAHEWDFKSKCPISHPTVAIRASVAKNFRYHEATRETDLYEFYLLDIHRAGHKFGYSQRETVLKMEDGRKRNKEMADSIKKDWYEKYEIY